MILRPMSEKRRARLAADGVLSPRSTFALVVQRVVPIRRNTGPSKATRDLVKRRSGGVCEWPGCPHTATDMHHRLNRKQGGRRGAMAERINGPAWLLHCCRLHHEWVTSVFGARRAVAVARGWILAEGQDANSVPVWTNREYGRVLLTDSGGWERYVG